MRKYIFFIVSIFLFNSCTEQNPALVDLYFFECEFDESLDFNEFENIPFDCLLSAFNEGFEEDDENWNEYDSNDLEVNLKDGEYEFNVYSDNGWCIFPKNIDFLADQDFFFEVVLETTGSGRCGLLFLSNDSCSEAVKFTAKPTEVRVNKSSNNSTMNLYSKEILIPSKKKLSVFNLKGTSYFYINESFLYSEKIETQHNMFGFILGGETSGTISSFNYALLK